MAKKLKRERESREESSEDDQDDEVLVEDDDLHPLDRPIKREALPSPPRSAFYCEPVSEADAANLARECAEVGRGLPAGALRGAGLFSFGEGVIPRAVIESEARLDGENPVVKAAGAVFDETEIYLENERKKVRVMEDADVDPHAPVSARRGVLLR